MGGALSRKEFLAYAKTEHSVQISPADADLICKALIQEGGKGVPLENFFRLKVCAGIAREKVMDAKRRSARLAKEKEISDMKDKLAEAAEEATKVSKTAEESCANLEAKVALMLKPEMKDMSASDMVKLADEADTLTTEAKDGQADTRKLVEAL